MDYVRGVSGKDRGKGMRVHDVQLIVCHRGHIRSGCLMRAVWAISRCSEWSWRRAGVGAARLLATFAVVYRGGEYGASVD